MSSSDGFVLLVARESSAPTMTAYEVQWSRAFNRVSAELMDQITEFLNEILASMNCSLIGPDDTDVQAIVAMGYTRLTFNEEDYYATVVPEQCSPEWHRGYFPLGA